MAYGHKALNTGALPGGPAEQTTTTGFSRLTICMPKTTIPWERPARYTAIKPGDVVSFSGIEINAGPDNGPMATVDSIDSVPDAAIAGVVASRFNLDAVKDTKESDKIDPAPAGDIKPGDYVLVVVRGATPVNINSDTPQPAPGSLLVSDAENRTLDAVSPNRFAPASTIPNTGQTIGVVLGELPTPADKTSRTLQKGSATRQVYVYVSPR